jgi:hypothetical protein
MKKFVITLSLTNEQAEAMSALWDAAAPATVLKAALDEFCIERYDAEHFIFRKYGLSLYDDICKTKVIETKNQAKVAKLLREATIEEEASEDKDEE